MELTLGFIARSLSVSIPEVRPAEHVRTISSGRARDLDHIDTWGALPNLDAVASDPPHMCLEIEACSGAQRAALSFALRKIRMELRPELPSVREVDRPEGAPVYHSWAGRDARRGSG